MPKTTFTAKQLAEVLDKVQRIDQDFPELPIRYMRDYQEFYSEDTFPLLLKKVGTDENVTVYYREFVGGDEAGPMSVILATGYGTDMRYFKKDGYYDSWDNGNDDYQWDGGFYEVESKEVTVTQWVSK